MLVEGATFAMPPHPYWFRGRDAVIAFLAATGEPDLRHVITGANGQPAIGWYLWDPPSERYRPASLEVLALERGRVSEITAFTGRVGASTDDGLAAGPVPALRPARGAAPRASAAAIGLRFEPLGASIHSASLGRPVTQEHDAGAKRPRLGELQPRDLGSRPRTTAHHDRGRPGRRTAGTRRRARRRSARGTSVMLPVVTMSLPGSPSALRSRRRAGRAARWCAPTPGPASVLETTYLDTAFR